jgi:hypothetical protein
MQEYHGSLLLEISITKNKEKLALFSLGNISENVFSIFRGETLWVRALWMHAGSIVTLMQESSIKIGIRAQEKWQPI